MLALLPLAGLLAACPDSSDGGGQTSHAAGDQQQAAKGSEHEGDEAKDDDEEDAGPSGLSERDTRELEALGYVASTHTDNPEQRGVTEESPSASGGGLNLYSSRRRPSAQLVDMDGEVVHEWKAKDAPKPWMHVEPLPSGDLVVIAKDAYLARYDWDSELIWRHQTRPHHDLAIADDGRILALVRHRTQVSFGGDEVPVLAGAIEVLSPDGELLERTELLPLMREAVQRRRLVRVKGGLGETPKAKLLRPGGIGDVLHTNSITILHRDIEGVAPAGSLLLSFRALSRIAILNAERTKVLWTWGEGELDAQHDATQLDNGHILLFDNGMHRGRSRVIELDPAAGKIVWRYESPDLFSRIRGGVQMLEDGHVLVTESDSGHAFEVTRDGEVVWEFWNPDVRGSGEDAERGVIYRMNRYPRSFFEPLAGE